MRERKPCASSDQFCLLSLSQILFTDTYILDTILNWKCNSQSHYVKKYESMLILDTFDLSIASTKTKYIKLNTKTQNIFCHLNENLTTFLYTLIGVTREKKGFLFKVYNKVECY